MPLFHERSGAFSPEKTAALVASIVPVLWLAARALGGDLGGRPVVEAIHFSGLWAVRFLIVSLAVTPLRRLFQWPKLILARRTLGLAALGYAALHVGLYVMDQGWSLSAAATEIALRFYLTIGAVAVALLLALGATSFDGAIRRLGGKRWNALHASVYLIAVLAIIHFVIQSKLDVTEAVLMGGVLSLLFAYRIAYAAARKVGPGLFAVLALVCGLLTAAGEVAWYGLATGIDPWLVARANLEPAMGLSPGAQVLVGGLLVALAALARQRLFPGRPPVRPAHPARQGG